MWNTYITYGDLHYLLVVGVLAHTYSTDIFSTRGYLQHLGMSTLHNHTVLRHTNNIYITH